MRYCLTDVFFWDRMTLHYIFQFYRRRLFIATREKREEKREEKRREREMKIKG